MDTFVRKAQDQAVVNSTTLENDADLAFSVGADQRHEFRFELMVSGHESYDGKFALVGPEGATGFYCVKGPRSTVIPTNAAMAIQVNPANQFSAPAGYARGLYQDAATLALIEIVGQVSSPVAGEVRLQFAQAASGSYPTTVKAESYVRAERVA